MLLTHQQRMFCTHSSSSIAFWLVCASSTHRPAQRKPSFHASNVSGGSCANDDAAIRPVPGTLEAIRSIGSNSSNPADTREAFLRPYHQAVSPFGRYASQVLVVKQVKHIEFLQRFCGNAPLDLTFIPIETKAQKLPLGRFRDRAFRFIELQPKLPIQRS